MNFFEKLDIFGIPIGLNYKNDNAYKTPFGGIVTIIFVALMASLFFSSIQTLFEKTDVNYVTSPIFETHPGIIEIDTNQYQIAVRIDQDNFIENPFFNITFERRHYKRYLNGTFVQEKVPVMLEPCTWDHFKDLPNLNFDWKNAFELQNLDDFLCLQKNQKINIGGKYENEDFYHLKYTVSKCKTPYKTNKWQPTCKTQAEIDDKTEDEDTRVTFLFTNYNLNPEKPSDISQIFLESMFFTFQPQKLYSTANIFINQQTITTDESLLPIEDTHEEVYPVYKSGDYKQQYSVGVFDKYSEIFFVRSSYNTISTRSFKKVDEVISYIGGFSQIFLLLFAFIELANKLYDFDFGDGNDKQNENNHHSSHKGNLSEKNVKQHNDNSHSQHLPIIAQLGNNSKHESNNANGYGLLDNQYDQYNQDKKIESKNLRHSSQDLYRPDKMIQLKQNSENSLFTVKNKQYNSGALNGDMTPQYTIQSPMKRPILQPTRYSSQQTFQRQSINQKNGQFEQAASKFINQDTQKLKSQNKDFVLDNPIINQDMNNKISKDDTLNNIKQERENSQMNLNRESYNKNSNEAINNGISNNDMKKGLRYYNAQQFLERELGNHIRQSNPAKLTLSYFINQFSFGLFCDTPDVQLLRKANDQISSDIDIYDLITRIKELEKIKRLVLDEHQQILFNFFPKPLISLDENYILPTRETIKNTPQNKRDIYNRLMYKQQIQSFKTIALIIKAVTRFKMNLRKNQYSHFRRLYDSYLKIQQTSNPLKQEINQRLIESLGKEMKSIFEATKLIYVKTDEQQQKQTKQEHLKGSDKENKVQNNNKNDQMNGDKINQNNWGKVSEIPSFHVKYPMNTNQLQPQILILQAHPVSYGQVVPLDNSKVQIQTSSFCDSNVSFNGGNDNKYNKDEKVQNDDIHNVSNQFIENQDQAQDEEIQIDHSKRRDSQISCLQNKTDPQQQIELTPMQIISKVKRNNLLKSISNEKKILS